MIDVERGMTSAMCPDWSATGYQLVDYALALNGIGIDAENPVPGLCQNDLTSRIGRFSSTGKAVQRATDVGATQVALRAIIRQIGKLLYAHRF